MEYVRIIEEKLRGRHLAKEIVAVVVEFHQRI
jgi:hypothetical protein